MTWVDVVWIILILGASVFAVAAVVYIMMLLSDWFEQQ